MPEPPNFEWGLVLSIHMQEKNTGSIREQKVILDHPSNEWGSECFGEYQFDSSTGCFKQVSSLQHDQVVPRYIYHWNKQLWFVNHTPGEGTGWLRNPSTSEILLTAGWQYTNGSGPWVDDPSIQIYPGKIDKCPAISVKLSGPAADKWPRYQGVFTTDDTTVNGRFVFRCDSISRNGSVL